MTKHLSHERLLQLIEYDPTTGVMRRRKKVSNVPKGFVSKPNHSSGYVRIRLDNKLYFAHRVAWFYVYGEWPGGMVDHINRDRTDNRISNLRVAPSQKEQQQNRCLRSDNKSGYTGVCFFSREKKWAAQIWANKKKHVLGLFDCPEDAFAAYKKAKSKLHTFSPEARQ